MNTQPIAWGVLTTRKTGDESLQSGSVRISRRDAQRVADGYNQAARPRVVGLAIADATSAPRDSVAWYMPARNLVSLRHTLSYNESYAGEPPGFIKQCVVELERLLPPTPVPAAPLAKLDPSGTAKTEMTLIERESVKLLNSLKAATDGGMLQLSEGVRMQIDVILMTAAQRRIGVA